MDVEILSRSQSHFLRRSPEKLQKGDFKRQQFRIGQNKIAKFVDSGMCAGEDN